MAWTTTPAPPQRKQGPGWTPTGTIPATPIRGGWFALLEKLAAYQGSGTLTATVTIHTTVGAGLYAGGSGTGTLTAAAITIRNTRAAAFSGGGALVGQAWETRAVAALFTGGGALGSAVNDGLTAIVTGGMIVAFTGGGALGTTVEGGTSYDDGLTVGAIQRYLTVPALSGTGTLTAAAVPLDTTGTGFPYTFPFDLEPTFDEFPYTFPFDLVNA